MMKLAIDEHAIELDRDAIVALYRALGFAPLHLYPEEGVQRAAARLYGKVRRHVFAHDLEGDFGDAGEDPPK